MKQIEVIAVTHKGKELRRVVNVTSETPRALRTPSGNFHPVTGACLHKTTYASLRADVNYRPQ